MKKFYFFSRNILFVLFLFLKKSVENSVENVKNPLVFSKFCPYIHLNKALSTVSTEFSPKFLKEK
jgi:hypothetical protein